jgi:hypothetical protein
MTIRRGSGIDLLFFLALLSTALALGGALAHALELPNKINLSEHEYFIVQKAYRGWNRLAFLLLVELGSMCAIAVLSRHDPRILWPTVVAVACLLCAQAAFWIYTYPANTATHNWTTVVPDWQARRRQWEYSHAVGALFQVLAMSALTIAELSRSKVTVSAFTDV